MKTWSAIAVTLATLLSIPLLSSVAYAEQPKASIPRGVYQVPPIVSSSPDKDLEIIGTSVKDADIVALGEAIHTDGTFHTVNARIARYLIEKKGFRLLTLETPHRLSQAMANYISCTDKTQLSYALQRIFPQFASKELSELYTWARQFNCAHPTDKVRFTGFDVQQNALYVSPAELDTDLAEPFVEDYIRKNVPSLIPNIPDLQLCGPTAEKNIGAQSSADVHKCTSFLSSAIPLVGKAPAADRFELTAALWSLLYNVYGQQFGSSDSVNSNTWRDIGMAKMISLIRSAASPGTKMIVIAHNVHAFRAPLQYWKNMGSYLDDQYGAKYFMIANLSSQLAALPFYDVNVMPPGPDSVESVIEKLNLGSVILNAKSNGVHELKYGLQLEADTSVSAGTPFVPISKLADVVIYSPKTSPMTEMPGVIYPPSLPQ